MPRESDMDVKRKAWLIILTAVIVMTVACFSPSVNLGNEIVPGYVAAALSVVGTVIGIAEDRPEFAVACGLGGMANIMFIVALISLILRHLFRWKRAHRRLSVYA